MRRFQVRDTLSTILLATMLTLSVMVSLSANVKPAAGQTLEWTDRFGDPQQLDFAFGVVADGSGAYTVGYTNGTLGQTSFGRLDAFIRKYDHDGNVVWTRQFGTIRDDLAIGVSLDSTGVYVAGGTNGTLAGTSFGRVDGFVAKFDVDGNDVWTRQFGTGNDDYFTGIAVDTSGMYLSGVWNGVIGTNQARQVPVVAKLDLAGNLLWTRELPAPEEAGRTLGGISLDDSGIYVAGSPVGVPNSAVFVTKLDRDGTVLWTRQFGSGPAGFFGGFVGGTVATGPSGVYAVNGTELRKYSGDGDLLWASRFSPPSPYPTPTTLAYAVSVDDSGVYLAGLTLSIGTFDVDVIVLKYDFEGNQIWTHEFGISESDYAFAISADASGIYTAGFSGRFDMTNIDAFVAKLTEERPPNNLPSLTVPASPLIDNELVEISFTVSASDPDADQTVTIVCNECTSRDATFTSTNGNPASGTFRWTPTEAQGAGNDHVYTFVATDNGSPAASHTKPVTVRVNEVNQPPVLASIGDKAVKETTILSFTAAASDGDLPAQPLTFSIGPAPSGDFPTGATITASGTFSWTPTATQGPGSYRARIIVSDGSTEDFEEITITVTEAPVNNPPVLSTIGNKQVGEEEVVTFAASATDPDVGQTVTFTATGLPTGASFSPSGVFTWTPTEAQGPGVYTVIITATDNGSQQMTDSETVIITVNEINKAPVLPALASRTVTQGSQLTFTITANDPDIPHTLTYSLEPGAPAGVSISASGVFSWTPTADHAPGTYTVRVRVSDGTASHTETFTVTVSARQPPPFWVQYWYVLLIPVLALAGIPVALKLRGKPQPQGQISQTKL